MTISQNEVMDFIKNMSLPDLNNFVKAVEEEFGVSSAAVGIAAPTAAAAAPVEEQTEFTVLLKEIGANKVAVIKVVREVTGLGLIEAKNLTDGSGKAIKEGVSKADAEQIKKKLEDAGAKAEIK